MEAIENLLKQRLKLRWHPGIQRLFGHQRISGILLRQRPEKVGQAGADRHLAAEQFHAMARTRFQRQMIALQPFTHFCHVVL